MATYPETKTYYYSRIKCVLLLLALIPFYAYEIYIIRGKLPIDSMGTVLLCVVSLLLAVRITVGVLFFLSASLKGKPGLILTAQTLYVRQLGQTIPLADIDEINNGSIKFRDPNRFSASLKSPLRRIRFRMASKLFRGSFWFSVGMLQGKAEEIDDVLDDYLRQANGGNGL